jgi:hypothetical protein
LSIPDEGESKGESCALNLMFMFLLIHLIKHLLFDVSIMPIFYVRESQLKKCFTIHPLLDKYHQYSWLINTTSKRHIPSKKYPYAMCVWVLTTQITENTFPFSLYCSLEQMSYHKNVCSPNNRLSYNQATCYQIL